MKGLSRIMLLLLVSAFFYQCQKEVSFHNNPVDNGQPSSVDATIQGVILDENDDPVEDALVKVGSKNALTDADGFFRILHAPLNNRDALVTVEKTSYFKAYRTFAATSGANQVTIKLLKKVVAGWVNSTAGGEVVMTNGTKISLPANAVVNASNGSAYSGIVNVIATYIDPSSPDILQTVPGSFMANDKNNQRVILSSFGMVAVELVSNSAEKLQIKSGYTATLKMVIPAASQSSAPNTIALWYVDEQSGIWKEEGTATKQGNFYVGDVKHFSFWNCDAPMEAFYLSMQLRTPSDIPIVNGWVRIRTTTTPSIQAYGVTDSLGKVSGLVPSNVNLVMEVVDPCYNVIYSQNIPPVTRNTDLGFISVNGTGTSVLTIQGTLKNCSGGAVTNGYAMVYYNNTVRTAAVNSTGNFQVTVVQCISQINDLKVLPVDEGSGQQGNIISPNITSSVLNMGNLSACGSSAAQYLNYTLDGTNYTIAVNPSDSMTAFTTPLQGTTQFTTSINGFNPPSNNFSFYLTHPAMTAGTYALSSLNVQNFNNVTLVQPFNVTFTTFPQNAGDFYEGNLTGQFRDGQNVLHNVSSNFRVRKTF
ncbi:MAG: hypothetical protein ACJ75F_08065 [Flavisolibacter sp.]